MKQAQGLSKEDLEQLGLTTKFVEKCEEIQRQGFLEQAACFRKDPKIVSLLELTRIHGVGEKLAHRWLRSGARTLEDVRNMVDVLPSSPHGPATGLTRSQRVALQFVDDFQKKIERPETERFVAEIDRHIRDLKIEGFSVACGGYRVGAALSSSVVLVVCLNDGTDIRESSEQILGALRDSGRLVADLSCGTVAEPWARTACRPAGGEPPYARVFLGIAEGLPRDAERAHFRRLDLVFCTREALPFATIQWSGNDGGIFNRELKRIAAFRGLHLSTTYLCRADREGVKGRNVGNVCRAGFCIPCATEEDVFAALGLPFRPPEKRQVDADMLATVDKAALSISAFRAETKVAFDQAKDVSLMR
jgi:DNA polymerase IV